MRAKLIYNKTDGTVTMDSLDGNPVSLWNEVVSDTSSELIINLEIEGDDSEDHENMEMGEVEDGD
jgi:hypothetical protein